MKIHNGYSFPVKVGEDEFGYMLADILKENNVNGDGMRFNPGARTALAFVTLRNDGEREFMFYCNPSADMLLQEAELDLGLITKVTSHEAREEMPYQKPPETEFQRYIRSEKSDNDNGPKRGETSIH